MPPQIIHCSQSMVPLPLPGAHGRHALVPLFKDKVTANESRNEKIGKCHMCHDFCPSGQEHMSHCRVDTEADLAGTSMTTQLLELLETQPFSSAALFITADERPTFIPSLTFYQFYVLLFHLFECLPTYMCVYHVSAVPTAARRQCWVP